MRFVIDRDKWRCGGMLGAYRLGLGETALLNPEGYMCCLGQVAAQCGVPLNNLKDTGEPVELVYELPLSDVPEILVSLEEELEDDETGEKVNRNSRLSDRAMEINDALDYTLAERELRLTTLFQEYGHELVFVGGQ